MSKEDKKQTELLVDQAAQLDQGNSVDQEAVLAEKDTVIKVLETKVQEQETDLVAKDKEIESLKKEIKALEKSSKGGAAKKPKAGEKVIRFLLSPAGKFKLPYNVGQEVSLHEEVAAEIVEAKYAEYVK